MQPMLPVPLLSSFASNPRQKGAAQVESAWNHVLAQAFARVGRERL